MERETTQRMWRRVVLGMVLISVSLDSATAIPGSTIQVRLENGSDTSKYRSGRVEMSPDGTTWKPICANNARGHVAGTVCKMQGFSKGKSILSDMYGNGTNGVHPYYVYCSRSYTGLGSCSVYEQSVSNCEVFSVVCYNNTRDMLEIRLVDGESNGVITSGRLEARIADLGWGAVCNWAFNDAATNLACKYMGYKYGEYMSTPAPANYSPSFLLESFYCSYESDLMECPHRITGPEGCTEDFTALRCVNASVRLKTTEDYVMNAGNVEMYVEGRGWSEVCDEGWDDVDAKVVCKELGFVDGKALCCNQLGGSVWGSSSISKVYTNISCTGQEKSLTNCSKTAPGASTSCPFDSDSINKLASVICYNQSMDQVDNTFQARLVHETKISTDEEYGSVQVKRFGFWGDVCPDKFTDNEATVACKMIGKAHGRAYGGYGSKYYAYSGGSIWMSKPIAARSPVWLTDFTCNGTEDSLDNCTVHRWGEPKQRCSFGSGVICYNSVLEVQLASNSLPYGRLDVVKDGLKGTICGDRFNDYDASIACKSLGYFTGKVYNVPAGEKGSGPVYMTDVRCGFSDHSLFSCNSKWKNTTEDCKMHEKDAGVSCFKEVALKDGDHQHGVVVVYSNGGQDQDVICGKTFDDNAAKVVCKQVGFANGYALQAGAYGRRYESINSDFNGIQCSGSEDSLLNCSRNNTGGSCYRNDYASVSCFNQEIKQEKYQLVLAPISGTHVAGRVQVFEKMTNGYICESGWSDAAANVLCKELGQAGGITYSYMGKKKGPFFVSSTNCTGNETSLDTCALRDLVCTNGRVAGVLCYKKTAPNVSLAQEGPVPHQGRMVVSVDGEEGRICGAGWTDTDANAACKMLGYVDGVAKNFPKSSRPLFMTEMDCVGSERSIFKCPNHGWRRVAGDNCTGSNATEAGVMCFNKVKLTDGDATNNTISGRLSVLGARNIWKSVCSDIDTTTATVACRELGFSAAGLLRQKYNYNYYSGRVELRCKGEELSVSNCTMLSRGCSYGANIVCYNKSENEPWIWTIENGYHGKVEVTHQGITGEICEKDWNANATNTLCRMKGFAGGIVLGGSSTFAGTDMVWFSNVTCPGNASDMSQCHLNTTVDESCRRTSSYAAAVLCYNKTAPKVRIVDGPTPMEGRVQIEYDGVNGTVCDNSWSRYDARALCKQLGYRDGVAMSNSQYGNGTGPLFMGGMRCPSSGIGSDNLFACHNHGWNHSSASCRGHRDDAGVRCYASVRLVGSETSLGPVSYYTGYTYNLVCADGFDDNAAKVVCRNLGFATGEALYANAFGYQSLSIGVVDVRCSGDEETFEDCDMELSWTPCTSNRYYASVVCSHERDDGSAYSVGLEYENHGIVTIGRFGHNGSICSNSFDDKDAYVVCREAGYLTGFAYKGYEPSYVRRSNNQLFWLSDLHCDGGERRLDECKVSNRTFKFGKTAVASGCAKAAVFCANTYRQTRIKLRVKNSNNSMSFGRVDIKVNGTWGRICHTYQRATADVICRQLGYASGDSINNKFGNGRGPLWIKNIMCVGNETKLTECTLGLATNNNLCTSSLAVQCHGGVRLNGSSPGLETLAGSLQVLHAPGSWVSVCASTFTNHSADVVCKEMGHSSGMFQNFTAGPWSRRFIGSADITCPSGSEGFGECTVNSTDNETCPEFSYVTAFCFDTTNPKEVVKINMYGLAGIPTANRYGFDGAICGKNFGNKNADVICKQQGFNRGYALKAVTALEESLPYVLSGLNCNGTETNIQQCGREPFVDSTALCTDQTSPHVLCTKTSEAIEFRLNPKNAESARAEVKLNGMWKLIDRYGFRGIEASAFCRSVGYGSGEVSYTRPDGLETATVGIGEIRCSGGENSLLECGGNWTEEAHSFKPSTYGVNVNCHRSVKLSRGSGTTNGMVLYNKYGSWGPVCADGFDDMDAQVVCRELGFDTGISLCCSPFGATFDDFLLTNVKCHGNESNIKECESSTGYTELRDCNYRNYASVVCYNNNDTRDYTLAFHEESNYTGSVELTFLGTAGRICNDSWDDADARVACREMNFEDGQAYSHYRTSYSYFNYDGPYWSSGFECRGDEARLIDCPHVGFGNVTKCDSRHFAGALCFNNNSIAYRIVNTANGTDNSGRVEVLVNNRWGTICNRYWDRLDAGVFCRSQGYSDGDEIAVPRSIVSTTTGPVFSTNLRCKGTESELNKCLHEGWGEETSYYCSGHQRDAGAFCYQNVRLSSGAGQSVNHGAVHLYRNNTWSLVCDANFDDVTARAVCRELGFYDGRAICCSAYAGVYMREQINKAVTLHCDGDESSLDQCIRNEPCNSGFYSSVICMKEGTTYNDSTYTVRRDRSSETEGTGKLLVSNYGVTGRICATGWTDKDAMVFCKANNYTSGFAYQHSHAREFPQETDVGPYFFSNFSCVGNETSLMQCPHANRTSLGNCSSGDSASVVCYRESGIQYRLRGGANNYGRVEMAIDDKWGTICNIRWDNNDANVICRYLNFSSGIAERGSRYGQGSGPVWLKDIQCDGTESALHKCPHTGFTEDLPTAEGWWFYRPPCTTHEDDASVFCYKNVRFSDKKTDSNFGGLQVHRNNKWMSVCDAGFSNTEATVACKSLMHGFQYGVVIKGSAFGEMDAPLNISSIKCTGSETDIVNCNIVDGTCSSGYYASISCSNTTIDTSTTYDMRIANDTYSSDNYGIVELYDNGVWKRVCHQGWDDVDASVACKELGFKGGVSYTHIFKHTGPMGARDFTCTGSEMSLQQCPNQTTPDLQECGFDNYDAGAICYNSTGLKYALQPVNSSSSGRVVIDYDGQIGSVCALHWTYNDSKVFCRSIGYTDGIPIPVPDNASAELGQKFLNAPFCKGTERALLDCLNSGFNSTYLSHSCIGEAYATCFNSTVSISQIRLMLANGTRGSNQGRVEIFVSGPDEWGTVCDDFWDNYDADVVCRSLSFQWGEAITNQTHGQGEGRIWLDNVECLGNESSLMECQHRGYGTHNCRHIEDAGVFCHNTPKPTLPPTTPTTTTTTTTTTRKPPTTTTKATTTTTTAATTTKIPNTPIPNTKSPTTTTTTTTTATTRTPPATTRTSAMTKAPPRTPRPTTPTKTTTKTTSTTTTTTAPSTTMNDSEHSGFAQSTKSSSQTTSIAVGVTVSVVLIAVVAVVLFILIKRRRLCKSGIPHQRFSDEVMGVGGDGSIAMQNQMYDAADPGSDPMSASNRNMRDEGEITLGNERAVYNSKNGHNRGGENGNLDNGFANPLYSVMQPFPSDTDRLHPADKQNGHSGKDNDANGSVA